MDHHILLKPLQEIVREIQIGNLVSSDLFTSLLERIEKYDKKLCSYSRLNPTLHPTSSEYTKNNEIFVPVAIKDLIDTKGIETNYGSEIFKGHVPKDDASVVKNLKSNGGIILGKTVTHEFALGILSPPCKNPWDLKRIPGGSSGGSAAAVAAGLSIFSIGSDTGGSIRIPASMCGVTGFKPSYGTISTKGVFPEAWSLDHIGPITRFAKDLPLEMLMLTGKDIIKRRNSALNKRKVGIAWDLIDDVSERIRPALEQAIDKIQSELDWEFVDWRSDLYDQNKMNAMHEIVDTSEIAAVHSDLYLNHKNSYMSSSIEQIEEGMKNRASKYILALRKRSDYKKIFDSQFKSYDILITPTLPDIAPEIQDIEREGNVAGLNFVKYLAPMNFTENPAISIPAGFASGLPVGIQIVAKFNNDEKCVEYATKIQEISSWHLKIPDIFFN